MEKTPLYESHLRLEERWFLMQVIYYRYSMTGVMLNMAVRRTQVYLNVSHR